jgi:YesN/AraC family two-component response regulator
MSPQNFFSAGHSGRIQFCVTDSKQASPIYKTRLLFVDDEEAIRVTLPAILRLQGFQVTVAASVPEALDIMGREKFDVLLTDLNIGTPADGFTLVSAMRRVQPGAATFILTGYPDFHTALEAIRNQVDDYFVKPADIPSLISTLKEKVHRSRDLNQIPCKSISQVIRENSSAIIERWLKEIQTDSGLMSVPIDSQDRVDQFPLLLNDLAKALEASHMQVPSESLRTAALHGASRARQGYAIPLLVTETRILNRVISQVFQENILSMDLSRLIPEALKIGEYLQTFLEESIRAFQESAHSLSLAIPFPDKKRKARSKAG